jgi:hypothetical protein
VPRFDFQLYKDQDDLVKTLEDALALAGRLGAGVVSLTGLLPSATEYGQALARKTAGKGLPRISTGHATTTAAVVLSIQRALDESGRDLGGEHVAFLGLGSIGTATLRLMLASLPHPAELTLCDVPSKRATLQELRREVIEEFGYRGRVNLLESRSQAPAELYRASFVVGATNAVNVLDVNSLRPGSIIVDDSGPHCFRPDQAADRLRTRFDLLYTEGGVLKAPEAIRQVVYMPALLEQVLPMKLEDWAVRMHPEHITGCVLSGLLSAQYDDLPPTVGFVAPDAAVRHLDALTRLGYRAPPLHCDEHLLEPKLVAEFRRRFGGEREARAGLSEVYAVASSPVQ